MDVSGFARDEAESVDSLRALSCPYSMALGGIQTSEAKGYLDGLCTSNTQPPFELPARLTGPEPGHQPSSGPAVLPACRELLG